LLEEEFFDCTQGHTPARCFPHLALYDGSYQRLRLYALAPVLIDGFPYGQRGLFVFHSSDGSRKFMLHKLYGTPSPQTEFYVSEL
jgi:hypothetical protein